MTPTVKPVSGIDLTGRPRARSAGLTHQRVDDELLIYDHDSYRCHRLGDLARRVLEACDGARGCGELGELLGVPLTTLEPVLTLLWAEGLLEGLELDDRVSRRAAMELWARGLAGGLVASLVVPSAAQAASCTSLGLPSGGRPCCPGLILNFLGICVPIGG